MSFFKPKWLEIKKSEKDNLSGSSLEPKDIQNLENDFEKASLSNLVSNNELEEDDFSKCRLEKEYKEKQENADETFEDCRKETQLEEKIQIDEKEPGLIEEKEVKELESFEDSNVLSQADINITLKTKELNEKVQRNIDEMNINDGEIDRLAAEVKKKIAETNEYAYGTVEYQQKLAEMNSLQGKKEELLQKNLDLRFENGESKGRINALEEYKEFIKDSKMINPGEINGVASDDPHFWEHHGNTEKDYMELASHLQEVKERVSRGELLDDLYKDPKIGSTAYQYFSKEKMIKITEENGKYEFGSDGRHRIEAAKKLGQTIPVHIVKIS